MKDPRLSLLSEQIEKLRGELNSVIATSPVDLHSARVYTLSAQLDDLIVRYMKEATVAEAVPPVEAFVRVTTGRHSSGTGRNRLCPEGPDNILAAGRPGPLGVDGISRIEWGMHLCHFYDTGQDLLDVLVPYFREGLCNNELCIWVTAEPLDDRGAREAMTRLMPDFASYVASGQMEIIRASEWYFEHDVFEPRKIVNAWLAKLERALAQGYNGLRVTGNVAEFRKSEWAELFEYEGMVHEAIGKYRIVAICSYPLEKCGAYEIIEAARCHDAALLKQGAHWRLV